jgi:DNA-binding FrmR family transcriptional regulator
MVPTDKEIDMDISKTTHHENVSRLARIEGQVKGVVRMIEEEEYCIDIITQIQAARSALQSVSKIILEKHIRHCVTDARNSPDEVDVKIEEIMTAVKRLSK